MNDFGLRLKRLREQHGVTLEELGEIIGCHYFMLRDWEKGDRCLKISQLIKLAKYFGVTTDYLLGL